MGTGFTILPDDAPGRLRAHLGIGDRAPRICYVAGTGDVVGTFRHWREGQPDPRSMVVTNSGMVYDLIEAFQAEGQIITPFAPPEDNGRDGTNIRFIQQPRLKTAKTGLAYFRNSWRQGQETVRQVAALNPDIILAVSDTPTSAWAGMARHGRLILSLHNTFWPMGRPPETLKRKLLLRLIAARMRHLSGAVCTSAECARQLSTLSGGRIKGVVEMPQIARRYEMQNRQRARRLLYIGRVEPSKGVFRLLDAFLALKDRHPDLTLDFAGSGSASADLQTAVEAVASKGVRYLGHLTAEEIRAALAQTDLAICPTDSGFKEGLALVCFEAAANGIPSVLSSVVPARDLMGDAAHLFEADDTDDLVRTLGQVIEDEALYGRMCTAARHIGASVYDRESSWGSVLGKEMLRA